MQSNHIRRGKKYNLRAHFYTLRARTRARVHVCLHYHHVHIILARERNFFTRTIKFAAYQVLIWVKTPHATMTPPIVNVGPGVLTAAGVFFPAIAAWWTKSRTSGRPLPPVHAEYECNTSTRDRFHTPAMLRRDYSLP